MTVAGGTCRRPNRPSEGRRRQPGAGAGLRGGWGDCCPWAPELLQGRGGGGPPSELRLQRCHPWRWHTSQGQRTNGPDGKSPSPPSPYNVLARLIAAVPRTRPETGLASLKRELNLKTTETLNVASECLSGGAPQKNGKQPASNDFVTCWRVESVWLLQAANRSFGLQL